MESADIFYAVAMSAFMIGLIFFPILVNGDISMKAAFNIIGYLLFVLSVIGFNAACVKFPLTTGYIICCTLGWVGAAVMLICALHNIREEDKKK